MSEAMYCNKTREEIKAMSEEEIIALENAENEHRSAYLIDDDYLFWAMEPCWNYHEGALLLYNLDPRKAFYVVRGGSPDTRTLAARVMKIVKAYSKRSSIGDVERLTVPSNDINHIEAFGEDTNTLVVKPKEFLEWAKSKCLPVPEMLWTAVFNPEELGPLISPEDNIDKAEKSAPVQDKEPEPEVKTETKEEKDDNKPDRENKKDAIEWGKRTKYLTKEFNKKLTEIILDYIPEYCNCNHRKIGEYIKRIWPDLHKKHFNNADLKKRYDLGNDPPYYIEGVCRALFKENYKDACSRLKVASTDEEKSEAEADRVRWKVVVNKHSGPKICEVSDHNVF